MAEAFQKITRAGRTGYAVAEFPRDALIRLVECPELPLRCGPAETIKAGNSALVVRAMLPMHGVMTPVAYKRVRRKTLLKQMTQALGGNRTLRTFLAGHRFLDRGVATARPLAVIVPSRFDSAAPTWIATQWIDGENLDSLAIRTERRQSDERRLMANVAAIAVGKLLGRMHAAGISHRDLKSQNLMVRFGADGEPVASVIDLDGAAFVASITSARRWKDLARLASDAETWAALSRTMRLRFLIAYLTAAGPSEDHKSAWRRISAHVLARRDRRKVA